VDLARDLQDHQLVDSDGVPCGRIDDIVIRWTPDGGELGPLLSGGAVVLDQLGRLGRMLRPLLRFSGARREVRIDWPMVGRLGTDSIHIVTTRESLDLTVTTR
jgi:hypothetical protein